MKLQKIAIPPGMLQVGTTYQRAGRWIDGNLVTWQLDGDVWTLRPIDGWTQRTTSAMTGKVRAGIAWVDNAGLRWLAFGSHSKLYALTQTAETPSDITPAGFTAGDADATAGAGYGAGPYGESTYGTPRVDNATIQEASMWSLDTLGENLYGIMAQDGILYKWQLNTAVVAAAVGGSAPTGAAIVVTPENFLMVLGAGGDSRLVQWADQETDSTWTPSATNQARSESVASYGKLMCGARIRGGTLIWTDLDVHFARYIGLPNVYSIDRIGENCGICSRGAYAVADTRAIWMGNGRFYSFDGVVQEMPCDVQDGVFGDFNTTQRSKVVAEHYPIRSEVWFFYPSAASTENDRAVVYNYAGNFWIVHNDISRLACVPKGVFFNPIRCDSSGYLWDHESGSSYSGDTPYAESGPIELGNGEHRMRVRRFIADEKTAGDVKVSYKVRDWPNDAETTYGPYTIDNPTTSRFSGRQVRMIVTGNVATSWRWGTPRLDLMEGGRR